MILLINLTRTNEESELQYIWRLCSAKDAGTLEMTWEELSDILNKNLREPDEEWTSSAYRKKYQQAKSFYNEVFSKMSTDDYHEEFISQKRELEQLKIQYRDERNAWNKQNYTNARVKKNLDYLEEKLQEIGRINFNDLCEVEINGDNDLIVCASDWHIGETFSSTL